MSMFRFALIGIFALSSSAYSQSINTNWKNDLNTSLQQFMSCKGTTADGTNPCHKYIGESLNVVYKINDFYSQKLGRFMVTSEIADFLKDNKQWTKLGPAYDQNVLKNAQDQANDKKAVVAVYMNTDGLGHLAMILPGELQSSGSWGLTVPNSASFLVTQPQNSYVGKGLSYAFGKGMLKDVILYSRNY